MILTLSTLLLIKKPSIAMGYLLTLYASEQLLMRSFPFLLSHQSLYNYFIGAICVAAIIVALFRFGLPWISPMLITLFMTLLVLGWSSLLWTKAPNAASYALTHFTLEGSLAIFLPFFIIREPADFRPPFILAIIVASICSLSLILSPVTGISGRTLLLEGATQLSPAELMGASIIILSAGDSSDIGRIFNRLKIPLIALLTIGCVLTGARAQIVVALIMSIAAYSFSKRISFPKKIIGLFVFTFFLFVLGYLFSDVLLSSMHQRFNEKEIIRGFNARITMIARNLSSLTDNFLFGKGVMGWAYDIFQKDIYKYPHNSIFQVFYELGFVGLTQFTAIVLTGFSALFKCYKKAKQSSVNISLIAILGSYFIYSFILSLKQTTFMACIGVYMGVSSLLLINHVFTKKI